MELEEKELSFLKEIFEKATKPLHIKGLASQWPCLEWTPVDWIQLLGDQSFEARIGKQGNSSNEFPQWESKCTRQKMTFKDVLDFVNNQQIHVDGQNFTEKDYWIYIAYFYMKDLDNSSISETILSWKHLGFPDLDPGSSTLWMGSTGANTPLHMDTYGFNIVVQLYGTKTWTLIPQKDSDNLYPTRIPYEESSIYSAAGFPFPNLTKHPNLSNVTLRVITLNPGDVLIVPKHWWHFVENNEFSISINSWIPVTSDNEDRVKEACVQYQIGMLCQSLDSPEQVATLLNPNMFHLASLTAEELLANLRKCLEMIQKSGTNKIDDEQHPTTDNQLKFSVESKIKAITIAPLIWSISDYLSNKMSVMSKFTPGVKEDEMYDYLTTLVHAFTDMHIVEAMKTNLLKQTK